jgi:hypothetical protein
VQIAPRLREVTALHPGQGHRLKPHPVAGPLLIYEVLHAARVGAQATHLAQTCVDALEAEDAPVVDRPGCKPVHLSFVEGAGTGKRHERRVEGGGEVIQAEKLPLRGGRGVERRLHVGPDGADGHLQMQVRPGASARVREPVSTENAGLDPVAGVVAEYGVYREGISPQRIQRQTEI